VRSHDLHRLRGVAPPPAGPPPRAAAAVAAALGLAGGPLASADLAELTARLAGESGWPGPARAEPAGQAWAVPLVLSPAVEAWLLGWPAGLLTPVHGHGAAPVAVTVVEGTLAEECLDPTIWTTTRRTAWPAGSTTVFPPGHVHLLGAAGARPAATIHAWSPGVAATGPAPQGRPRHSCVDR
jgi:quercetin dioxygenase-like cupin family protein